VRTRPITPDGRLEARRREGAASAPIGAIGPIRAPKHPPAAARGGGRGPQRGAQRLGCRPRSRVARQDAASTTVGVSGRRGRSLSYPSLRNVNLSYDPNPLGVHRSGFTVQAHEAVECGGDAHAVPPWEPLTSDSQQPSRRGACASSSVCATCGRRPRGPVPGPLRGLWAVHRAPGFHENARRPGNGRCSSCSCDGLARPSPRRRTAASRRIDYYALSCRPPAR